MTEGGRRSGACGTAGLRHLTWAHQELFKRLGTAVTRRGPHDLGRVLHGGDPRPTVGNRAERPRAYWGPAIEEPVAAYG